MTNGDVKAILLDAGGVLVFPEPKVLLPPLRAAGVVPSIADLERAHYRAMSVIDHPDTPDPDAASWWRSYLLDYVAECGVAPGQRARVAADMAREIPDFGWTHVGPGVPDGLAAVKALGVPVGIVSNSDGTVEGELRRLGVCWAAPRPSAQAAPRPSSQPAPRPSAQAGVEVGVVIDSAAVGVAKPHPEIFAYALGALGVEPGTGVIHVGDSLRYDVTGALAAGLRPVHLDPYQFCPAPDGHEHVSSLLEVAALAS